MELPFSRQNGAPRSSRPTDTILSPRGAVRWMRADDIRPYGCIPGCAHMPLRCGRTLCAPTGMMHEMDGA